MEQYCWKIPYCQPSTSWPTTSKVQTSPETTNPKYYTGGFDIGKILENSGTGLAGAEFKIATSVG
ncbi:hypothetical protein [Enterococcus mundtii]|uniref:hypothetical protein n=1 Tax=Enterococcus mundtii TaxID=53346 RepID=UPI0035C696ED